MSARRTPGRARHGAVAALALLLMVSMAAIVAPTTSAADFNPGTPDWVVTEHVIPSQISSEPTDVVVDGEGNIWSSLFEVDKLSRLDPATGEITLFEPATTHSGPLGLGVGADGTVWFTEVAGKIGHIDDDGTITEFTVPAGSGDLLLTAITLGPDGAMWFTDQVNGRIGRITTSGTVTMFDLTDTGAQPTDIVAGPDGALWFSRNADNSIGRITTSGTETHFDFPDANSQPLGITVTADDRLAVALNHAEKVALVTTAGTITTLEVPLNPGLLDSPLINPVGVVGSPDGTVWVSAIAAGSGSQYIVNLDVDGTSENYAIHLSAPNPANLNVSFGITMSDDDVWFAEPTNNRIGQLSSDPGGFSTYPLADGVAAAEAVTDAAGNVWFSDYWSNRIGTLDPETGIVTLHPLPTEDSQPLGVVFDAAGNLWFTEYKSNKIGRIDGATGELTELDVPTSASKPSAIALGPDGNIWFIEETGKQVGRVDVATGTIDEFSAGTVSILKDITAGPDGNLWIVTKLPAGLGTSPSGMTVLSTDGAVVTYHPFHDGLDPQAAVAHDGGIGWDAMSGASIGTMTTEGTTAGWAVNHGTRGIIEGPDGNLWWGGYSSGRLGTQAASGIVEHFPGADPEKPGLDCTSEHTVAPLGCELVYDLAGGPNGEIWLTTGEGLLVRYQVIPDPTPPTTTTTANPTTTSSPTTSISPTTIRQGSGSGSDTYSTTGQLPATGSDTGLLGLVGVALVAAGALVLAVTSRQRRSR